MEEFDEFSPQVGFMCHRRALANKKPESWRSIHLECPACHGPKVLCSFQIGNPPAIKIWICVPCHNAQPKLSDIIEANSMKDWPPKGT